MSEYDLPDFEPSPDGAAQRRLPGGLSLQALAAILLVIALLAILYLFLGPTPDAPTGLATSTPRATSALAASGEGTPAGNIAPPAAASAALSPAPASTTLAGEASMAPVTGASSTPGMSSAASAASSTPAPALSDGSFAQVGNTDGFGLRLRFGPGFDFATIRIVPDGELLKVLGDAEASEGYNWVRLQDALGNVGWGAQDFLSASAGPSIWSPPLASPTFEADAASP